MEFKKVFKKDTTNKSLINFKGFEIFIKKKYTVIQNNYMKLYFKDKTISEILNCFSDNFIRLPNPDYISTKEYITNIKYCNNVKFNLRYDSLCLIVNNYKYMVLFKECYQNIRFTKEEKKEEKIEIEIDPSFNDSFFNCTNLIQSEKEFNFEELSKNIIELKKIQRGE
jgi:hypothetical protein